MYNHINLFNHLFETMHRSILLIFAFLLFAPSSLWAQSYAVDKGSVLIGGTGGLTSTGSDFSDDRNNVLRVNPAAQFFVVPGLALGGEAFYSTNFQSGNAYGLGPAVSYYLGGPEQRLYPFASATLFYSSSYSRTSSTTLRASAGAAFMIAKNVALTGEVFYQTAQYNVETDRGVDGSQNQIGLTFGIDVFVF